MGKTRAPAGDEATPPKRKRRRKSKSQSLPKLDLDNNETLSLVCKYFCKGVLPAQIADVIEEKHGIEMHREQPYKYIAHAAEQGWIQYVPPPEYALRERLKDRYRWLDEIRVAHTQVAISHAESAAVGIGIADLDLKAAVPIIQKLEEQGADEVGAVLSEGEGPGPEPDGILQDR